MTDLSLRARRAPFSFGFFPGPEWREAKALVALAAPITGAALVNMGMSITDTVMMGWIGPSALAAGAVVSDLYSIIFYFAAGLLSIVAPLAARAAGANDPGAVGSIMRSGIMAALIIAPPAFFVVWFTIDIIGFFGIGGAALSLGRGYAQAMAFTIVPMILVSLWRTFFAAIGRPHIYLAAIALALPLNALANQVFMFGWGPIPPLGIAGAGIASALVANALLIGFILFSLVDARLRVLGLYGRPWRIAGNELGEIFRLGIPIGFFTVGEVGIFLIATLVISLFGTEALAAHAIALRIAGVVYAIPTGLSQAATIRVAHAIGRGDGEGLRHAVRSGLAVGIASGTLIFAVLVVCADILPGAISGSGAGGIAVAVSGLLVLLGMLNFAQGFAGPAAAILRGFKDTRTPMVLCLTGYWLIGMPVGVIAGFHLGLGAYGVWLGLASGVAATAVMMNLRLASIAQRAPVPCCPAPGRSQPA